MSVHQEKAAAYALRDRLYRDREKWLATYEQEKAADDMISQLQAKMSESILFLLCERIDINSNTIQALIELENLE